MNESRTQLIAQIINVEHELYAQKIKAKEHQKGLLRDIPNIIGPALLITTLTLLLRSKHKIRMLISSAINMGKVVLLNYFKKQIVQLVQR